MPPSLEYLVINYTDGLHIQQIYSFNYMLSYREKERQIQIFHLTPQMATTGVGSVRSQEPGSSSVTPQRSRKSEHVLLTFTCNLVLRHQPFLKQMTFLLSESQDGTGHHTEGVGELQRPGQMGSKNVERKEPILTDASVALQRKEKAIIKVPRQQHGNRETNLENSKKRDRFVEGMLNICYNAIDRHIENGEGDKIAIIYDSPVTNTKAAITYKEVLEQVSKLAGVLAKHGIKKGDTVVIYMPMIPQAMYAMLACARLGAIHSLIFGGFASKELSSRIDHAKPKIVITASFGIEPGRRVEYIPLIEEALRIGHHKPDKVLIYNRPNMETVPLVPGRDLDWDEEMAKAQPHDCVPVHSEHPLYILYTSGTTGLPKGVVRPTGGYAVMLNWSMSSIYGLKPGEVWWAASDLGWVVGHSYICYGPLLHGNTTVLYEGKPVGTPDAGAYFRVLAEHGVAALFTAPTAIRAIRQQDPGAALGKQYSLTRFKTLFVAGERCDVETLEWSKKVFRVPVLDHWWQTETGSPITASCIGLGNSKTPPPGQAGKCVPGYNVMILDDNMQKLKARSLGNIVVKLPLPPGAFSGLWKNQEAFKHLYFEKFPGYYDTMDAGYMDEEGYVYVMSRVDDVINVAGHRISAGSLEESILSHGAVADCAVVGKEDPLKGHVPLALCVLRNETNATEEQVLEEIVKHVRQTIGPVAAFRNAVFVKQLPKTRSGKIPRNILSALVNGKPYKVSPTIEDPNIFGQIEEVLKQAL